MGRLTAALAPAAIASRPRPPLSSTDVITTERASLDGCASSQRVNSAADSPLSHKHLSTSAGGLRRSIWLYASFLQPAPTRLGPLVPLSARSLMRVVLSFTSTTRTQSLRPEVVVLLTGQSQARLLAVPHLMCVV